MDDMIEPSISNASGAGMIGRDRTDRVSRRYDWLLKESESPYEWAFAWRTEVNRGGFRALALRSHGGADFFEEPSAPWPDPSRGGIDPCFVTPSVAPPYHQHSDFVGQDGDRGRENVFKRRCQ